ncbi:tRNA pseudouridine(38-40) synthase TruA [Xanthomonas nasturtii]|uniref:tRNA pseudouridine(38-40) synthase TruA n=1 Tax=Xanthomonas nasturtii TaxID=1843581 RepID=UPI002010F266|nr:tRNA pseudouridine(38-40) synthase TruA [Xanthomonas nasturtii]MCL1526696.1 tRNA pseudouridine(38-40) synthase TruA [Xanthomonas nasturtii]MCL1534217.1 tRNA pseudouridine(38-40) synthase TruA [Xanthomonas nasturtii]MCL1542967.1 tRNA pseudouridine(38-40) synthase TruA [Xanthomonas nasturtii]
MRYALGVEYDGSEFQGWQQLGEHGGPSVQASLQAALSSVADAPVQVVCAGRTDAGVHGECQVVHFDSDARREPRGWMLGTTARLPPAIAVRWCVPAAEDFHARFSARARRYRYRLLNRQIRPALYRQTLSWERRPLDADAMHAAAQALLGENDFSAFRSVQCQALHARRNLQAIHVQRIGEVVEVQVQANAFLHHMVRNIVGSLILVGTGEQPADWIATLLAGRDRTVAGPTAPPQGLVFIGPLYPAEWHLPAEVTQ